MFNFLYWIFLMSTYSVLLFMGLLIAGSKFINEIILKKVANNA